MKKFLFYLCMLVMTPSFGQKIKIDLKTPMEDKEKLKLAKAGLGAYLRQAEWVEVVNLGEDYSVWVKNLKRKFRGNSLLFEVDLEIRTRADLRNGDLISSRHLQDTLDLSATYGKDTLEEQQIFELVEQQVLKNQKYKPVTVVIGSVTNVPILGAVVEQGLKYLGVELETKVTPVQAIEGMVLGAVLMIRLKEMFDQLPPNKK